jgi:membrane-bound serine protease (ClpP class)
VALVLLLFLGTSSAARGATVDIVRYEGAITPVAAEFIVDEIERSENEGVAAVVIELDTPGGLDTAMRDIVKAILNAEVPVVVYVSPPGSRAASAGVFITMAAHVAAMAPGTNIGSASPVSMMGAQMDSTMSRKVTNDAVAYLEGIAERRGRNGEWASRFVVDAENLPAERALEEDVIDVVALDREELLEAIDGWLVKVDRREVRLETSDAELRLREMGFRHRILSALANPALAYLLLLLGMYGIFFELSNPGSILPGVVGAIAILLALFALQALPISYVGLALMILAMILFILEIFVTSYGLLSIAGVASLVIGSLMLFQSEADWARLSLKIIVPAVSLSAAFFLVCVWLAIRGQRRPVSTGKRAMLGEHARVSVQIEGEDSRGKVVVHGEVWNARAEDIIPVGATVEVIEVEGRTVVVRRLRS